jgi:hypothetical protein
MPPSTSIRISRPRALPSRRSAASCAAWGIARCQPDRATMRRPAAPARSAALRGLARTAIPIFLLQVRDHAVHRARQLVRADAQPGHSGISLLKRTLYSEDSIAVAEASRVCPRRGDVLGRWHTSQTQRGNPPTPARRSATCALRARPRARLRSRKNGPSVRHCHVERDGPRSLPGVNAGVASSPASDACLLPPDPEGFRARASIIAGRHQVAARAKVTVDNAVG